MTLDVCVLSAVRTPVGRRAGALSPVRVDDLAALVISAAVERAGIAEDEVGEVFAGCVNVSGEAMGNLARYAALLAGLPYAVAGVTLNRFCASGLSAVNTAAHAIAAGAVDVAVAVGAESMSRSTWPIPKPARPFAQGPLVARDATFSGAGGPQHPLLEERGDMIEMPEAAQALVDRLGLRREALDAWALRSHERAAQAEDAGLFEEEIAPVPVDGAAVARDETIRRDTTAESLARLRPYFDGCPDITAGNASPVNDGASALVLASPRAAERLDARPLARIRATASIGVEPALMGLGAARAILRLGEGGRNADVYEVNEAFASVVLAVIAELGLDEERVNPRGGALALGHALGNSGTRIATTLLHELRRRGGGTGVASLCVGGGQGVATLFEMEAP